MGAREELDFPDDAGAAPVLTGAAGIFAERVAEHAYRIAVFEGLDRRVHGVCHVGMDAGNPVHRGAGAHSAAHGLVVGEPLSRSRIDAPKCPVVHRPLAGGGDLVRQRLRKALVKNVHDPLGSFNIAPTHSSGRPRIHDSPRGSDDLNRTHPAGI